MLDHIKHENVLFLDIETVPQYASYQEAPENFRKLWERKSTFFREKDNQTIEESYNRAAIFAEFGKIVCISVGFMTFKAGGKALRIKSFYDDDEKKLLINFNNLLNKAFNSTDHFLCAHNGKEFDFPYIARRNLINQLRLPVLLDTAGKKPWEVKHIDTLELWKFGDYKHYTSLELLTAVFNIPTPKDDISGKDVGRVYWQEKDLEPIVTYCQKDVLAIVQLYLRYKGEKLIDEENVEIIAE